MGDSHSAIRQWRPLSGDPRPQRSECVSDAEFCYRTSLWETLHDLEIGLYGTDPDQAADAYEQECEATDRYFDVEAVEHPHIGNRPSMKGEPYG
jgi:hypothetical protein